MTTQTTYHYYQPESETASRECIQERQWSALQKLLEVVYQNNPFYRAKWQAAGVQDWRDIGSMEDFQRLPFVTREELTLDQEQHPPHGTNLTWPLEKYTKWHRTSGSKNKPLVILSTPEDWETQAECWVYAAHAIGLGPGDSAFIPFSFGPFMGLWAAQAGVERAGLMMMPGGGMTTLQRLQFIFQYRPTVINCLPSYALRMAEVARENGMDLREAGVRVLVHAGEPGPSTIPSLRARLEAAWNARAYDLYGLSETGHVANECFAQSGPHIVEDQVLAEVLQPGGTEPVPVGEVGEMVITALTCTGMPMIRYRTRDLVRLTHDACECGRTHARLLGGILGRMDGMVVVRGINVYPTAIEECLMSYPQVSEFQVEVCDRLGMKELRVRIETSVDGHDTAAAIARDLRQRLSLRAEVELAAPGSLPRFEGKARRFIVPSS